MRRLGFVTGLVVASAVASAVLADVPPPEGYVEECTVAKQQTATSECLACASMHGQSGRCASLLAPYCYLYVCQTYGASAWSEVLCRAKDPRAPAVPADVSAQLASPPSSWLADGGVATVPSTCAPYVPGQQNDEPSDGSGCNLPSARSPVRELGPAMILLGVLALIVLRRRRRG
jgi:hypothetical protein